MKTHRTLSLAVLLCAAFASCGRLPTDNPAAAPEGASYDSGYGMGTGGVQSEEGGTMDSDSTGRGGYGMGTGH